MALRPAAVRLDRAQGLLIIPWSDGHESAYAFRLLREACPCEGCEAAERPPTLDEALNALQTPPRYDLARVELVGNYALRFTWGDGHDHGIYSWELLRALCPCAECTSSLGPRQRRKRGEQ